jgi:hypothetical protein
MKGFAMIDIEEYIHELNPSFFEYAMVTPFNNKHGYEWICDESEATFFRVALVSKNDVQTLLWICDTKNKQAAHAVAGRLQAWINGLYA